MIINHRENGLSTKNWANNIATYHNWGHGSHGKIDPITAIMHRIIHITQQTISISYLIKSNTTFMYWNAGKKQDRIEHKVIFLKRAWF